MDVIPANRDHHVPRLVEASRRLGLPVLVPIGDELVDRTIVETSVSAGAGIARTTTSVTVVLEVGPLLHLTTSRQSEDGDADALQTAVLRYALNADPAALRDPSGHLESVLGQSATLEATPAPSEALIDGERWDGIAMRLGQHHAWSGHRGRIAITLIGPAGSFRGRTLGWAGGASSTR